MIEEKNETSPNSIKTSTFGRTPWDFAAEAIKSKTAMLLVSSVFLIVPLGVHYFAEPTSEINLFGLIKYKKASPPILATPSPPKEVGPAPNTYLLPDSYPFKSGVAYPILDGTINVMAGYTSYKVVSCVLSGANIRKVLVAARSLDGHSIKLHYASKTDVMDAIVAGWEHGCVFEVYYSERYFQVHLMEVGDNSFTVSVKQIPSQTLGLKSFGEP
jgi:hypothetical protein